MAPKAQKMCRAIFRQHRAAHVNQELSKVLHDGLRQLNKDQVHPKRQVDDLVLPVVCGERFSLVKGSAPRQYEPHCCNRPADQD